MGVTLAKFRSVDDGHSLQPKSARRDRALSELGLLGIHEKVSAEHPDYIGLVNEAFEALLPDSAAKKPQRRSSAGGLSQLEFDFVANQETRAGLKSEDIIKMMHPEFLIDGVLVSREQVFLNADLAAKGAQISREKKEFAQAKVEEWERERDVEALNEACCQEAVLRHSVAMFKAAE